MATSENPDADKESGGEEKGFAKKIFSSKEGPRAGAERRRTPERATVLIGENGQTAVYQRVVAKIAGLAVQEVDGVRRLVPAGAGQRVTSVARSLTGSEKRGLGVDVQVEDDEAVVNVRVVIDYGASIPAVADAIRRNVSERIEGMTGLHVAEVNIDIVDLSFGEGEEVQEPEAAHVQGGGASSE